MMIVRTPLSLRNINGLLKERRIGIVIESRVSGGLKVSRKVLLSADRSKTNSLRGSWG
jgi:hypothetical protein